MMSVVLPDLEDGDTPLTKKRKIAGEITQQILKTKTEREKQKRM